MMWYQQYMGGPGNWGFPNHWWGWMFPLVILDVILKGFALWRSARRGETAWFIALLFINSLGILPGIYLLTHPEEKTARKKT